MIRKILLTILLFIVGIGSLSLFKKPNVIIENKDTLNLVNEIRKADKTTSIINNKNFNLQEINYSAGEDDNIKAVVYDKDSKKEKIIFERDKNKIIVIPNKNNVDSINGIKIGDPIQKVIQENGKDFYIYGFEWDYGGLVKSWNNGKFKDGIFTVKFKINSEYNDYVINNLIGNQVIYTKDIDFNKADIIVDEITFKVN